MAERSGRLNRTQNHISSNDMRYFSHHQTIWNLSQHKFKIHVLSIRHWHCANGKWVERAHPAQLRQGCGEQRAPPYSPILYLTCSYTKKGYQHKSKENWNEIENDERSTRWSFFCLHLRLTIMYVHLENIQWDFIAIKGNMWFDWQIAVRSALPQALKIVCLALLSCRSIHPKIVLHTQWACVCVCGKHEEIKIGNVVFVCVLSHSCEWLVYASNGKTWSMHVLEVCLCGVHVYRKPGAKCRCKRRRFAQSFQKD